MGRGRGVHRTSRCAAFPLDHHPHSRRVVLPEKPYLAGNRPGARLCAALAGMEIPVCTPQMLPRPSQVFLSSDGQTVAFLRTRSTDPLLAKLFLQGLVLSAQVLDHLLLLLAHPARMTSRSCQGCRTKLIGHAHGGRIFGLRGQWALRRASRDAVFDRMLTTRLLRRCKSAEYFYPTGSSAYGYRRDHRISMRTWSASCGPSKRNAWLG
jgi:hypothetical protein